MKDNICLVTGANTGIGLETARGLASDGATVVMTSRDREKGAAAVREIIESTGNDRVSLLLLDLASRTSIIEAATKFKADHEALHVLINNAGLMLSDRRTTKDGFETTFGVNHLGHFLFVEQLRELIEASAPSRIINVASEAHRSSKGLDFDDLMREKRDYSGFAVYCDSKLANILYSRELARRVADGVVVHSLHPGAVRSGFAMDGDTSGWFSWVVKLARPFLISAEQGARTSLHVARSDEAGSCSGKYWKKSRQTDPTRYGQDDAAAKRLWEHSEELLGATLQASRSA